MVPMEARRYVRAPGTGITNSYELPAMRMLEIELESPARASIALNQ